MKSHYNFQIFFIKFRYCEKATKLERISNIFLKLLCNIKTKWEIFSIFCGLLRIFELYLGNLTKNNYKIKSLQDWKSKNIFFEMHIKTIFWHQKDFWPIVWGLCLYYYVAPLWRKFLCLAHPSFVSSYQIFHFMHDFQGLKSFQLLYGLNKQRLGGWMTLFVLSIMTLIIL